MTERARGRRWASLPLYPAVFLSAWLFTFMTESPVMANAVIRPLVVGLAILVIAQVAVSLVLRNRHLGAMIVLTVSMSLIGLRFAALALLAVMGAGLLLAAGRRKPLPSLPWQIPTRWLNVISAITLALVLAAAGTAGALNLPGGQHFAATEMSRSDLPDIYLILLDGYPRSDTQAKTYGYDNEPFLGEMGALGFDVARHSHSNYNMTILTLSSMFNMTQVDAIPELADPPSSVPDQYRTLTGAIIRARAFDALRSYGYEIVSIPSPYTDVTPYSADRILDSGQMTWFEYEIFRQGALPNLLPDLQARWLVGQHRERVAATFRQLGELAAESSERPKFVFAHVMSPHPPLEFGPNGEEIDGWPCFPAHCSIWEGGQAYGEAALGPIGGQIGYVNSMVRQTAQQILANSPRPPVIIFFSDHGQRHDFRDADEMLRSFFLSSTPGQPDLFPDDMTPINVVPRLLNAYAGAAVPMATEESYWLDLSRLVSTGPLRFSPRTVADP